MESLFTVVPRFNLFFFFVLRFAEIMEALKEKYKTSHFIKIDNFSLIIRKEIRRVQSSIFNVGGHKWCVFFILCF